MNQRAALSGVLLRQQLLDRNLYELRITHVSVTIGNRQSHDLPDEMKIFRAVVLHLLEIKALKEIELLKYCNRAARRGLCIKRIAAIGARDRFEPERLVMLEILFS